MEALSRYHSMSSAIPMRAKTQVRLIGRSPQMVALRAEIDRVARSRASVLITGENGSVKELVARSIHDGGPRAEMPFVTVNRAGLPDELLERELCGDVGGATNRASSTPHRWARYYSMK